MPPPHPHTSQEPPGGGMRPAAVITSYILYAYSAELQLLARHALNTFAILQVGFQYIFITVQLWGTSPSLGTWPASLGLMGLRMIPCIRQFLHTRAHAYVRLCGRLPNQSASWCCSGCTWGLHDQHAMVQRSAIQGRPKAGSLLCEQSETAQSQACRLQARGSRTN